MNIKLNRILVPTDFSANAEKALFYAADIADKSQAHLYIYHSYIPVEGPFIENEERRNRYNASTELDIERQFLTLKERLSIKFLNLRIHTFIGKGPLVNNICSFAETNQMDLIVMGTQGASGLQKVIIGSISASVGQKTTIPLLLIPPNDFREEPKQIVFASNYHNNDSSALHYTLAIGKLYQSQITYLHLIAKDLKQEELTQEQSQFQIQTSELKKKLKESVTFQLLETSSIGKKIENLNEVIDYDLLVMIPRKKSFFERLLTQSLTRNMSFVTQKPLLVIPEAEKG